MSKTDQAKPRRWEPPKVEKLDIDLTAVAQGNGSTADMYKAANARASR